VTARAACPACGATVPVDHNNRLRAHRATYHAGHRRQRHLCPGSGRPATTTDPKETSQ
jgi:hypothetical protein